MPMPLQPAVMASPKLSRSTIGTGGYMTADGRLTLADIRVGDHGGTFNLSLWAKNIFDRQYLIYTYPAPGVAGTNQNGVFGLPRTLGGSLMYKFLAFCFRSTGTAVDSLTIVPSNPGTRDFLILQEAKKAIFRRSGPALPRCL